MEFLIVFMVLLLMAAFLLSRRPGRQDMDI